MRGGYKPPTMHPLAGLALFVLTVAAMEIVAYVAHRWVMHGFGWFLHKSHHEPRTGAFEANDWYAVIFATPSIALLYLGVAAGKGAAFTWIGAGIAAYGAIYFGFHDWLVHRRLPHRIVPTSGYLKRIMQAHRLHHAVTSKHGTVSFGFLVAPPVRVLKAQLRAAGNKDLRAAAVPCRAMREPTPPPRPSPAP